MKKRKKLKTEWGELEEVARWVHPKLRFICITWRGKTQFGGKPYEVRECYKLLDDGRVMME